MTFRFFIQGNEKISFKRMMEFFRTNINDESLLLRYQEATNALNQYLDGDSIFNINGIVSRRDLIETFIYGDLAHANNSDKRDKFKSWMRDEVTSELMRNEFMHIIGKVLIVINQVDKLCKEAVEKHDLAE